MPSTVLVSLCTYNERENVEALIPEIFHFLPEATILVVDDNSPDGTGTYVAELTMQNPRIRVLRRPGKLGLGTAIVAAFRYAIEQGFEHIINLDADFSHPPRFLPDLYAQREHYDVVIGSRYVPGGQVEGWGAKRHIMSQGINLYAKLLLGLKSRDNSGSYRCYRVSKLAEVDWSRSQAKGFAFQEEVLYRLRLAGATFIEIPICFEERRHGTSKISWKEAVYAGWDLLKIRLTSQ